MRQAEESLCSRRSGKLSNDYPVISPLVKTKWDQGKPYNDECPRINGVRCVTGCVATAMAQVMNFHKYPERGEGTVIIELKETDDPVSLRLSDRAFDWDNMLDSYVDGKYNKTQSSAVAYLMKACGYSVDMSYSTNESGAAAFYVGKALINNFNYNKNISYEERKYYTSADWQEMVYKELEARRPVLYSGHSEGEDIPSCATDTTARAISISTGVGEEQATAISFFNRSIPTTSA